MKLLNLGCGNRYHAKWVNIDFISEIKDVIEHNLLNGIPFSENEFDVVYHSHVLEHFSRTDGKKFIAECYRVLKPGGIIRIAVPDLEQIVKNYLVSLEGSLSGDAASSNNYEWMMLELYDQTVRNYSGGEMAKYFQQPEIKNEKFVFSRVGEEGKSIRENFLKSKSKELKQNKYRVVPEWKGIKNYVRNIRNVFFHNASELRRKREKLIEIGKFRTGGEIHQWMYDRYSLGKLLSEAGFHNIAVKSAFESVIENWNNYKLESESGVIFKPDSLFMEAQKF